MRNFRCPIYPECLDLAARQNAQDLPCAGCTHERDTSGGMPDEDFYALLGLLN